MSLRAFARKTLLIFKVSFHFLMKPLALHASTSRLGSVEVRKGKFICSKYIMIRISFSGLTRPKFSSLSEILTVAFVGEAYRHIYQSTPSNIEVLRLTLSCSGSAIAHLV